MPGPSGLILIDKPGGITSHGVVARTRKRAATRKVGHAGTLDPMATGLLLLGLGSSTRLLTYMVGLDKEYEATIRLGQTSSTDDADGEVSPPASRAALDAVGESELSAEIEHLIGNIEQVPSTVSAIKVDGKRAYARARAGEEVVLKPRSVTVSAFDVLDLRREESVIDVDVRVECSSGTYIRALARDLGTGLSVGGHLTALRRTRVGPFRIADAVELEELNVAEHLLSPVDAASALFPTVTLDEDAADDLSHGRRIGTSGIPAVTGAIAAIAPDGRLIGLMERRGEHMRTLVNFPEDEGGSRG